MSRNRLPHDYIDLWDDEPLPLEARPCTAITLALMAILGGLIPATIVVGFILLGIWS